MHEVLFNDDFLSGTGVETIDFAKALIDKGYHPMTIYFLLLFMEHYLLNQLKLSQRILLINLLKPLGN